VTPLIAPLTELTQTAPNKGKISKEISAEALLARPRIHIPPSPPPAMRPAAPKPASPSPPPAPVLPEPPKIETAGKEGPQVQVAPVTPPPQIQAQEKPKLAFENPNNPPPPPASGGLAKVPIPNSSVNEAVRSVIRGGPGRSLSVSDIPGGIGSPGLDLPSSPGRPGSALELLSDPMGVDFQPYLIRVLAMVKRNWLAVMPESAKLGQRGKVGIQFAVNRNGSVPKLVIVLHSGADALDRAAVAGISASNPLPQLPSEYKGDQIRLQFTFLYNMPSR
jgi:TonB family protein